MHLRKEDERLRRRVASVRR
jgi:chromosome segregation ATPase